jgi:hypothetical protein
MHVIYYIAAAYLTGLGFLGVLAAKAPLGWEDAEGFHFETPPKSDTAIKLVRVHG